MFKQPLLRANCSRKQSWPSLAFAFSLALFDCGLPALAKHDTFLFGDAPKIDRWYGGPPDENDMPLSPMLKKERDALFALYVAPVLLPDSEIVSSAVARRLPNDALSAIQLLPSENEKSPQGGGKYCGPVKIPSYGLNESIKFLRWRLQYLSGAKSHVSKEIEAYLKLHNAYAEKSGNNFCADLFSLGLEFGRQQRFFDQTNLTALGDYFTVQVAHDASKQTDLDEYRDYERHVAEAYAMAQLDSREPAKEYFGEAINYLRSRPQTHRPQTDGLRKELLRLVDEDLVKYEDMIRAQNLSEGLEHNRMDKNLSLSMSLSADDIANLKQDINRLIDVAYLAKIDGRLSEAAFLFRRAYLLVKYYFPANEQDYTALHYDLGETLFWDDKFEDSVFYLSKCVALRSKDNPLAVTAIDTNNLLGRVRLVQGKSKNSLDIFFDDLTRVARRVKINTVNNLSAAENEKVQSEFFDALLAYYPQGGSDERRQIEDGIQGVIDASLPLKQYDLALLGGEALLQLRSQTVPPSLTGMIGVLWGLAYACDCSARPQKAVEYYDRLIKDYGAADPGSLPYWYHGRGLDLEMMGHHAPAVSDIKKAITLYQEKLKSEEDEEARDHISWTVADLQLNLHTAEKYSVTSADYANLPDNCYWRLESFPLKIYLDSDKAKGFGGELRQLVEEAVALWTDYEGSPLKVTYTDNLHEADIFIERVTVYDDIPYGSAGRTSATFERKGEVEKKVLTRTHVRVYCPSFDGNDWENQDIKMSAYAKTQFKYLLVHELGHVFGLTHSPAGPDIMYWKSCAQQLSNRDMSTIKKIYEGGKSHKKAFAG